MALNSTLVDDDIDEFADGSVTAGSICVLMSFHGKTSQTLSTTIAVMGYQKLPTGRPPSPVVESRLKSICQFAGLAQKELAQSVYKLVRYCEMAQCPKLSKRCTGTPRVARSLGPRAAPPRHADAFSKPTVPRPCCVGHPPTQLHRS